MHQGAGGIGRGLGTSTGLLGLVVSPLRDRDLPFTLAFPIKVVAWASMCLPPPTSLKDEQGTRGARTTNPVDLTTPSNIPKMSTTSDTELGDRGLRLLTLTDAGDKRRDSLTHSADNYPFCQAMLVLASFEHSCIQASVPGMQTFCIITHLCRRFARLVAVLRLLNQHGRI
jgi:hypothetical protein